MPEEFNDEPIEIESSEPKVPRSPAESVVAAVLGVLLVLASVYFGIAQGMAALVMFPGIPLVLLWFVYWFFLRRLLRIRRMRAAEDRRLMREAAQRPRNL